MDLKTDTHKNNERPSRIPDRRRRGILIGLQFFYALIGWLRLYESLNFWHYLLSLNLWPRPMYMAITGGAIGFLFSLAIILSLFKSRFAPRFSRWLGIIFLIWFWLDRIWFSTRDAFFNQLVISVMISVITIFWVFILIKKKDYFWKNKEVEKNGNQTGTGSQILPEQS